MLIGGRLNDRKAESEQVEILEVDSGVCNCTSGLIIPVGFLTFISTCSYFVLKVSFFTLRGVS